MGFRVVIIPPSVSESKNCGLVESSTEVAAVVAGYTAKKVVEGLYLHRLQKTLNF